jgi:multidrug resistance efflux pump
MRLLWCLAPCLCAALLSAQTPGTSPEDAEIARARQDLLRVQGLVESGALPPVQLEKARAALQDAEDSALIRRSIYITDLTEDQADALVAAATRQLDRRQAAYDEARRLVDVGAAAQMSLSPLLIDLDFARKQSDLAETRARLAREMVQAAEMEAALETRMKQAASSLRRFCCASKARLPRASAIRCPSPPMEKPPFTRL